MAVPQDDFGALLAAKHTVFMVVGEDKAEAVRSVFKEEYDPKKYPAQIASHHGRGVTSSSVGGVSTMWCI